MTRESMDKIVFPVAKTIAACVNQAAADSMDRTMRAKFYGLASAIGDFCKSHSTVRAALLDPREQGRYLLMLVVNSDLPDAGMGDDVSSLQMDLYRNFPEFPVSVMTVPAARSSAIATFVDPENALLLYAVNQGTSGNR
jgi:hypothetical protein